MAGLLDLIGLGQYAGAGSGGLLDGIRDRSNQFTGLGAGLLSGNDWSSGLAQGFQGGALGKGVDQKQQDKRKQENATKAWLAQHPELDPATQDYVAQNPDAQNAIFANQIAPKAQASFGVIGEDAYGNKQYGWIDAHNQSVTPNAGAGTQPVGGGMDPNMPPGVDPKEWRKLTTKKMFEGPNGGEGGKAPSGFRWLNNDPASGQLEAIPGGPGEQLPAEVAGRIGLAKDFIGRAPDLRKRIENGELDGIGGSLGIATGIGKPGEIGLEFEAGKEALVRQLTGAGKSESEAKDYANQYSPSPTDSKERILYKLDALTRRLQASANEVGVGHGGSRVGSVQPQGPKSTAVYTAPDGTTVEPLD